MPLAILKHHPPTPEIVRLGLFVDQFARFIEGTAAKFFDDLGSQTLGFIPLPGCLQITEDLNHLSLEGRPTIPRLPLEVAENLAMA